MSPSYPSDQTEKTRPAGLFGRLRDKLAATQRSLTRGLSDLLLGGRALDETLFEELENLLLSADVGVDTTRHLMQSITDQVSRKQLKDTRAVYDALRQGMLSILGPCDRRLEITPQKPFIIMVVGVNGVGKTTTIAKLANHLKNRGLSLTLAAADTFRAAAIEQLKTWAERLEASSRCRLRARRPESGSFARSPVGGPALSPRCPEHAAGAAAEGRVPGPTRRRWCTMRSMPRSRATATCSSWTPPGDNTPRKD